MRAKQAKAIRSAMQAASRAEPDDSAKRQLYAFARKFLLAAGLTILPISLTPEAWFGPLNRLTALNFQACPFCFGFR